ncbi:MAG: TonB-dependent receptor [Candidatus Riflebacteria bacterium]|nr:TonB-dependent receptor [Candidatus Riflebacteria bacterium]
MIRQKFSPTAGLLLLLSLLIVVSSSDVCAQSTRSRGMGGAFIGLSDDESAIFYNPAGLSQIQGGEASIQAKVNERDVFDWTSLAFTGHIYEDQVDNKFSITDYLEHNILEEPIPRRPKYSYGVAYTEDNRSEQFGQLVGGEFLGTSRKVQDLQLAFGTRFPIARRMLAREQLYGGIKLRHYSVDRWIRSLQQHSKKDSTSLGIGLMYHYNDRVTGGLTVDNLIEDTDGTYDRRDGVSLNLGTAVKLTKGTTISVDAINVTNSARADEQQYRIGVEKKFIENDLTMRMGSLNGTLTLGFGMYVLPNIRVDYSYYDGDVVSEHHVGAHVTFE